MTGALSREEFLSEQLERQTENAGIYLLRAQRYEKALRRILGLLAHRRWWNDNAWAAEEIAKETLLDVS